MYEALQRFNDWMSSHEALAVAVAFPVGGWLLVLCHELAHAVVGVALGARRVLVTVGQRPGWVRTRVGSVELSLSLAPSRPAGSMTTSDPLSPGRWLLIVLAGPMANGVMAAVLFLVSQRAATSVQVVSVLLGLLSTWMAVGNLIPRSRVGWKTDGARALELFRLWRAERALPGPELVEAFRRFLAQLREPKLAEAQVRELTMPAKTFGLPPAGPAGTHLCGLALAGWCWGEANNDNNFGASSWIDPTLVIREVAAAAKPDQLPHIDAAAAMTLTKRAAAIAPDTGPVGRAISAAVPAKHGVAEFQRQTAIRYGMALHLIKAARPAIADLGHPTEQTA